MPPSPDSSTQSWPSCQRGECGIDSPASTDLAVGTSIRRPPFRLFARQPPAVSVVPRPVTIAGAAVADGQPVEVAAVSGASAVTNGGRQRGTKLCGVARAEAGEPGVDEPQLVADPGHLVDADVAGGVPRAGEEAGVVAAGRVELAGTAGTLWNSQT